MKEEIGLTESNVCYHPCLNCGSLVYDNVDIDEDPNKAKMTKDGRYVLEPIKCDCCSVDLVYWDSYTTWN